jgi:serine/threonine-protein kinase
MCSAMTASPHARAKALADRPPVGALTLEARRAPTDDHGISFLLPPDLVEKVRDRVALLSLLLFTGFAFEPLVYFVALAGARIAGAAVPADMAANLGVRLLDAGAALASLGLWWVARRRTVSATRLHWLGLAYEVVVCFVIAFGTMWEYTGRFGMLPFLTWLPAVVLFFPLVLPGPPARMLGAAIVSGAMSPLAVLLLELLGRIDVGPAQYVDQSIQSALSVGFAYAGARVVYGLGREVAAARALGSYYLEEQLGRGGMGEVWRARHQMLARPAAIKLIRPAGGAVASEEAVKRFELEAQAIARLRSPHTVTLFDFGVAQTGGFYYAMELLDGLDADRFVKRFGPLAPARTLFVLRQMCHSLAEADACGLVHRDIKPANVFLCRYGEDADFVKVLDFGLVKAFGDAQDTQLVVTQDHHVRGTPAFMSPEQALGAANVDTRADIYATGCVAYWFLTGHNVFEAETPMGLLLHHAHTAPEPPSARTETPIPAELDRLVLACLAKDPAQRPQSARELSVRLTRIATVDTWTEGDAHAWWEQHLPRGGPVTTRLPLRRDH